MDDFSKRASDLYDQFTQTLSGVNLSTAVSLPHAMTSLLAMTSTVAHHNQQGLLPPSTQNQVAQSQSTNQASTVDQLTSALSRGFANMKALLASKGQALLSATSLVESQNMSTPAAKVGLAQGSAITPSRAPAPGFGLHNAMDALFALQRNYVAPDLQNGRYSGLVLGETESHVLLSVNGRAQTATAIDKSVLGGVTFAVNKVLDLQFKNGQVVDKGKSQSQTEQQAIRQSHRR
ncbi:hypothetical protein LMG1866_04602 [Achromobacter ruhlandii]|uniref:hypothetical protein n=1 Tax=Achromobacter ruhlandii TaxID=72557 RepID=UPI001465AEC9|nr:hypothetical protein [Achromobacter ruhlandii]CAB3730574.1 hypothetical protein LMG1866_04602 [Achromobacter ruhlandii]